MRPTNQEILETKEFQEKCAKYKVMPTKRQVSKLRCKRGLLYRRMRGERI